MTLPKCEECPFSEIGRSWKKTAVRDEIIPRAPIVFVGMAPSQEEVAQGRPFAPREGGKPNAGSILKEACEDHGFRRGKDYSLVNLLSCQVPKNDWKGQVTGKHLRACEPRLVDSIKKARAKVLVALGTEAMKFLVPATRGTRISSQRGRVLESRYGNPVIPTLHPAYFLYNPDPDLIARFHDDLERVEEFIGRREKEEYSLPFQVKHHPVTHTLKGKILVDIETDVETDSPTFQGIRCFGISKPDTPRSDVVHFAERKPEPEEFGKVKTLIGHNVSFDYVGLVRSGAIPRGWKGILEDTTVLQSLRNENLEAALSSFAQEHGYHEYLSLYHKCTKLWKSKKNPEAEEVALKNQYDVSLTTERYHRLKAWLRDSGMDTKRYYDRFLVPVIRLLAEAQVNGLFVNESIQSVPSVLKKKIAYRRRKIRGIAGWARDVNVNGTIAKRELLFDQLELEPSEFTDKRKLPALSRSHLDKLLLQDTSGAVQAYADLSFLEKELKEIQNLLPSAGGLCHPHYNLGGRGQKEDELNPVVTGRLSAQDPNPQNFKYAKPHISSRFPGGVLLGYDLSQMEVRGAALYSQDPELLRIFEQDLDPYLDYAEYLIEEEEDFKDEEPKVFRSPAKRCLLSAIYDVQGFTLSESLNLDFLNMGSHLRVTPEKCSMILRRIHHRISVHYGWVREVKREARDTGQVKMLSGRVRHLPPARGAQYLKALRQACNAPIQGVCSDINLLGALEVGWEYERCLLVLLVHDAAVWDCPSPAHARRLGRKITRVWKNLPTEEYLGFELTVPMKLKLFAGQTWADKVEYDSLLDLEAALEKGEQDAGA